METTTIKCPDCGSTINVNEILYHQLQDELKKEYNNKLNEEKKLFQKKQADLEKQQEDLKKVKAGIEDSIALQVNSRLVSEKGKLEKILRNQVAEEKSEEIKSYQDQLDQKTKEIREHNRLKADYQKLQREKSEMKERLEAEAELRITTIVDQERRKIKKELEDKNELKLSEREHVITQLKNQLKEAQKKAEQGSSQIQGEVMETGLQDWIFRAS